MDSLAILSCFSLRTQDSNTSTISQSPCLLIRSRLISTLSTALGPPVSLTATLCSAQRLSSTSLLQYPDAEGERRPKKEGGTHGPFQYSRTVITELYTGPSADVSRCCPYRRHPQRRARTLKLRISKSR